MWHLYSKCIHLYEQLLQAVKDWFFSCWEPLTVIRCLHAFFSVFYTAYRMLYYCNMVVWSWWDWNLIWTTIFVLQCYDTFGWVIWPVNTTVNSQEIGCEDCPQTDLWSVDWDVTVKLCCQSALDTHVTSFQSHFCHLFTSTVWCMQHFVR